MAWGKWFKDDRGDSVKEKTVKHDDGSSERHFLRASDGDRQNHDHVWTEHDTSGKITSGHGEPKVSERQ